MTITNQTRKFVNKLSSETVEIDPTDPFVEVDEPFIVVVPSYEVEATDIMWDFLDTGRNVENCKGVVGAGNRNFANLYCFTAKNLAVDYDLPYLHELEFQGSNNDVESVTRIIQELSEGIQYLTPREQGYMGDSKSNYASNEIKVVKR